MFNKFNKMFLILMTAFSLSLAPSAMAQEGESSILQESVGDLTTVAAIGLGGAILGLSTLSFTEEPKDHLKNILVGGAIGIIAGVGIVAWQQATKSKGVIESHGMNSSEEFSTARRVAWQKSQIQKKFQSQAKSIPTFSYNFSF
ncbi:hypothetical protein BIY24_12815 [Halobacteriovorax marinus]|uniref:Membrane protein n=1 Tax=Halobacteriovorax marinus (strain ATCC BAA-682 / DSM 15412 / SJ) TaxID=862908 RepID=E1WXH8_HALMS|nr:hypothetical protein [Halobacteriovorax marinus]ATH08796.1 hypothetical protein BIY24_12815 [Halobacteriovorax marinus]CBW27495.1 putative membrane protein [Halobacteriovorax marinus SJ]